MTDFAACLYLPKQTSDSADERQLSDCSRLSSEDRVRQEDRHSAQPQDNSLSIRANKRGSEFDPIIWERPLEIDKRA